ncbi:MAG: tetratricopeptide repeat protein [Alphaproteobacteria bacterium]
MADFLDELQEDIRQEKYENLWKAYGHFLLLGVFLILAGTGLYIGWRSYQDRGYQAEATSYQRALDLLKTGKKAEALELFKHLETTSSGYGLLAKLRQISLQTEAFTNNPSQDQLQLVRQHVEEIVKNRGTDGALKGLLSTHLALLVVQTMVSDPLIQQGLEQQITPHNPWKGLGLEIILLQAFQQQNMQRVETVLSTLMASRDVPSSLQTRIGLEAIGAGLGIPSSREHK